VTSPRISLPPERVPGICPQDRVILMPSFHQKLVQGMYSLPVLCMQTEDILQKRISFDLLSNV